MHLPLGGGPDTPSRRFVLIPVQIGGRRTYGFPCRHALNPKEYGAPDDRETLFSKRVAKVRQNQVKAHARMMRSTGSAPPYTADESYIQRGDYVRVARRALRKCEDARRASENAPWNANLKKAERLECDGSPQWHDKVYRVTEVINFGEAYRLDGFHKTKDGGVRQFMKADVQKYNHVRIGDIVRISMTMFAAYRRYVNAAVQGNKNDEALMFNHTYTRALYRVTEMDDAKTHYFLELVWDPTKPLDGRAPFPLLRFEAEAKTTKKDAEDDPAVPDKDKFRGFRPSELLVADRWTNDLFNNPKTTPEERQNAYTACVVRNQVKGKGSEAVQTARKLVMKTGVGTGGRASCDARFAIKQYLAARA